ncbi:hypothetical protein MHYP_G00120710 [Metynnis hypsauchen]
MFTPLQMNVHSGGQWANPKPFGLQSGQERSYDITKKANKQKIFNIYTEKSKTYVTLTDHNQSKFKLFFLIVMGWSVSTWDTESTGEVGWSPSSEKGTVHGSLLSIGRRVEEKRGRDL